MSLEMLLFLSGAAICAALSLPMLFENLKTEFRSYSEADVMEVHK